MNNHWNKQWLPVWGTVITKCALQWFPSVTYSDSDIFYTVLQCVLHWFLLCMYHHKSDSDQMIINSYIYIEIQIYKSETNIKMQYSKNPAPLPSRPADPPSTTPTPLWIALFTTHLPPPGPPDHISELLPGIEMISKVANGACCVHNRTGMRSDIVKTYKDFVRAYWQSL